VPARTWTRAPGIAAAIMDVTSASSGGVSDPVMSRVGTAMPVKRSGCQSQPSSMRASRDRGRGLGPVRCRPPIRDLIFCEPGNFGRHQTRSRMADGVPQSLPGLDAL
jgi:hypothetical protein